MLKLRLFLFTLLLLPSACATQRTLEPQGGFVQPLGREHALVGRAYDVAAKRYVSVSELEARIADSQFLVIGESHENRDHHALEAELVDRFLEAHPGAAVAFEMLDENDRAALQTNVADPDALARAVRWEDSGWPEFSQYRPVFEVALARAATIVAAHPSAANVRASLSAIDDAEARALHLDRPLAPPVRAELEREIRDAHCGHAPETMVSAMVRAQSYKDAFMARSLVEAATPAVLITGAGHARKDRAVPYFMHQLGKTRVLSIGLLESDDARLTPERYEIGVFDLVIFTPRVSDADPCARFKEQLEQMKNRAAH